MFSGIETKFKNLLYPVIITPAQVPEMNMVTENNDGVVVGAGVSLTRLDHVMKKSINKHRGHFGRKTFRESWRQNLKKFR